MDITEDQKDEVLRIIKADSEFLASLNLIDYSMLVLEIRNLNPGESDGKAETQALQVNEDGEYILKKIQRKGLISEKTLAKQASGIVEERKDESSDSSLEQDYYEEDDGPEQRGDSSA